jgi:hypothetical protein
MPRMQMGLSSYERARGDLPGLPVINMTAEAAPSEEGGVVLQSRPGLEDRGADMGAGPVLALFQRDNVLGTALFGVSDGKLYQGTTSRGGVDGAGPFSIAGYENFVFTAGGAGLWGWSGTALAEIAFPDDADVAKVIVAASRVVAIREDTGQFYWSDPLETDIEALDFATAESQPDRLRDCLFIDNTLLLFGAETVEFWPGTGDAQLPFQPLQGRVIERGIRATGCAVSIGSTFAWVTNLNQVCLTDENTVISNPGLQVKIAASASCSLWTFILDGVEYLALRLDTETHVWSLGSQTWTKFESYGEANWIPQCFAGGVFGSSLDGATMQWGSGYTDLGGVLERRFRAGFPLNSGGVSISNVQLRSNVGQTPFLTGDYAEPVVEMRLSRDAGQTWGNWRGTSLGAQGQYRRKVQWRACGLASQPGLLAEFRVTDPVPFRASAVLVNEPYGGR